MSIDQRKRQKKLAKKKSKRKAVLSSKNKKVSLKIVEKLFRNCGEGNFEYIVSAFDESKIL